MPFGLGFFAAAGAGGVAGSFDLLETQILTGTQAGVDFTSLDTKYAADYKHLQLRILARDNRASVTSVLYLRMNGDTGGNYSNHTLYGTGSGVGSDGSNGATVIPLNDITGANETSTIFTPCVVDILDAFSANKVKTVRSLGGQATSYNWINLRSGARHNSAAITSLNLLAIGSFVQGCRFSLYGIKGA